MVGPSPCPSILLSHGDPTANHQRRRSRHPPERPSVAPAIPGTAPGTSVLRFTLASTDLAPNVPVALHIGSKGAEEGTAFYGGRSHQDACQRAGLPKFIQRLGPWIQA